MDREGPAIKTIADTARWMAFYRALESERPDAHFQDPYARLLAGERGQEIARSLPWGLTNAWALVVRTRVFDELIMNTIEQQAVDTILNLGAGFDTRPYRLPLPAWLRWIEVDLPEILAEKEEQLVNEQPSCCLTRVPLDLADGTARRALFARLEHKARQVLVVTEGVLIYLTAEQVGDLASDLHTSAQFRWWLTDLVSPAVARWYQLFWASELAQGKACWRFAPEEGERFFLPYGWHVAQVRATMEEAARLKRDMPLGRLWRLLVSCSPPAVQQAYRTMSCFLLLQRA
ncbi:MAG TPA: class I SAM-dependent methyltransferase [Ktedonobacteraceae bacterium]